jgi:5-(carboxyamino)imidazole ribonucleotide mutase
MNAAALEESTASGKVAVALFAPSAGEMAALQPCAALLDKFGVERREMVIQEADCRFLEAPAGLRVAIVASRDGGLPAALAAAWSGVAVIRAPAPADGGLAALTDGRSGGGYATVALGEAGARNAALLAVSILALTDPRLREAWEAFRQEQTAAVLNQPPLD